QRTPGSAAGRAATRALDAGHAAERAHRPDLALAHYRKALLSDPSAAGAHHRLAVLLDQSGNYATAEQHYAAALSAQPGDADLLCDLGYSYLLQGRAGDAEDSFRTALAQQPDHQRSLENLGLLYAKQNDRSRAAAALAQTGTRAEVDAKLALLFPASRPVNGYVAPADVPLWAGVAPNSAVTPASAFAPPANAPIVRTAEASRPVSLLMQQRPAGAGMAADSIEPPYVPPPSAPAPGVPAPSVPTQSA
ncbi:tetratricopeptide repeat protein, partial [Alienimonas chondri]|uniref:tetratricopeptide repeat protein n=1 Tax=Alienimonas chondri TaxID=2681879 RepID=UPI001487DBD8